MAEIGLRSGKVRKSFYRCGYLNIIKGDRWCVYDDSRSSLPIGRFRTLSEARWWAAHNQPSTVELQAKAPPAKRPLMRRF